jgi:Uma2 family endonuclease
MAEAGVFHRGERVELIDGDIIQMTPIGERHAGCVTELTHSLVVKLGDTARISVQNPVRLRDGSEPQPDIAVLRQQSGRTRRGHPTPSDILLLIEVCDGSLRFDRDEKAPLYARDGIPESWVVDLEGDTLLIFRDPSPHGYQTRLIARRGDQVTPVSFPGREFSVDVLLS